MGKLWVLFLLCVLSFVFPRSGSCAVKFEGINPGQPIAPGGIIYYDEILKKQDRTEWLDYSRYVYLGAENNNLRLKYYGKNDVTMQEEENDQIAVPINDRRHAIVSVNRASADLPPDRLLVVIIDENNNITAEKYIEP